MNFAKMGEEEYIKFYQKIGSVIFDLRKEKNFTQEHLAHECGMESNNLSQIERGLRNPTSKTLYLICKALNITLVSFFEQVENK